MEDSGDERNGGENAECNPRLDYLADKQISPACKQGKSGDFARRTTYVEQELAKKVSSADGRSNSAFGNGYELASGSIRIHDPEIQKRIFDIVGFSAEQAEEKFGFLLKAFRFGAPPHGGIAPGLDRLVMIMSGVDSIKDVIAFPKNNVMASPMDDSPSDVEESQLRDLGLAVIEKEVDQ